MRTVAANSLETAHVLSPAGENVGKIVDFMLDTERRTVEYAVLAVGGVLGVGAKMLAIPPRALKIRADGRLELAVDTATLAEAPGIDRANPPEGPDPALRGRARTGDPARAPRGDRHG